MIDQCGYQVKPQGYGKTMTNSLKMWMPNFHKKLDDQCLLIDMQSFEAY
jgi:hypothetical protein